VTRQDKTRDAFCFSVLRRRSIPFPATGGAALELCVESPSSECDFARVREPPAHSRVEALVARPLREFDNQLPLPAFDTFGIATAFVAMAAALGPGAFLGGGVRLGNVRGFGSARAPLPARAPRASLGSKGDDADAWSSSSERLTPRARRASSKPKPKPLDDPNEVANDLWRRAQSAREAAKGVACFAALSSNGAAFAQLQTNAQLSELWRAAEDLEEAALAAWKECGEDFSFAQEK